EMETERISVGLFPSILNLAANAVINSNATCGDDGPEMFCKLVEHVPGQLIRNAQCRICDKNSLNPKERHPISNAIDGTNNWWQSPSIQNGREFHRVTVTLDLRQVFQVAYIIIKAANSPRPGNWILERSIDGIHFSPWQYYAISDTDCLVQYNITPRLGPPTYKKDDEVICTSYYSKLVPLEHGEIHTSLINGRPGADDLSPTLLNFTSARFVRLSFQKIRTLNADLMTLSRRDPKDLDPIVTRRYYYSIKDISIGGMCICYGHANSCPLDATKKLICKCEHNTCGDSCDKCCPGFHQQLWKPGTISSGNTCEECNCHNKTKDCYYDQSVADQKKSMNLAGEFKGGGVCINCQQNTAGINCETCADGYYRPHNVSPRDEYPCQPCNCDPWGSLSSICTKEDDLWNDGNLAGQCQCKEGYTGQKCDRCQFGYKDYPRCSQCTCNEAGSISDLCDEPCLCKENVEGDNCDVCKAGSFNLNKDNPEGCTECFCFGVSDVCDSLFWPVTEMPGWLVTFIPQTKSAPSQQDQSFKPDQSSTNATENIEVPESEEYYWSAPLAYLGNKVSLEMERIQKILISLCKYNFRCLGLRIVSSIHMHDGNGITISTKTEGVFRLHEKNLNVVKLVPENFRDHNTKKEIDRDNLTVCALCLYLIKNSCLPGYYRVGGILFGGICQPCECNGHASDCDIHGVCIDCKDNTTGENCDQCLPGFYGNASQGTPADCQPCKCPLSSSSNNFSPTCSLNNEDEVICDKCQTGYIGNQCERCADGYYGNPTVFGESCIPCDCNDNVDPLESDNCDTVTGECLKCIGNTGGRHCERCADGYHGDAVVAKNCSACWCHETGSVSNICNYETGVCNCKPNVIGQHCDQCANGYFDLKTGVGCQPCNCHKSGSVSENCDDEGKCQCVPGVAGQKCDQCARGFYNYQDGSCTPCDCEHTQNSCDSESGECICPPNTKGLHCEDCEDEHWGHDPDIGCKPCNCSNKGSTSHRCDLESGQCLCKKEYAGKKCNECAFGFRDYPDCVPCNCDGSGTREDTCDGKVCSCEKRTGFCTCKENVFGLHCSECKMGTFALHDENPLGCSPCFCFGMTRFCSELEGYIRIPITIIDEEKLLRVVSQDTQESTTEGVYYQSPDVVLDVFTVREYIKAETLYWELPNEFLGDQLMAYGGKLKYIVTFYSLNGTGSSNGEPQIIIKGGRTNKFTIYANITTPKNGVRTYHEVDMIENYWKYFNSASEEYVIRSHFMLVLSNIDYILIKASHGQALLQSRIANISLEIGIKAEEGKYYSEEEIAYYLENCHCPPGTAGFSCQDCAPGYHRAKFLKVSGNEALPLIASCVPCECNNHTETCHPETGQCLNCRDNTAGDHCDICAPGYYGKVRGSVNDCSVCECPRSNASFSPTCHLVDENDFRCDACAPGYEGPYCEKCGSGYYGNPFLIGGSCQACNCDPNGSVHGLCNTTSGQCICKPGVSGRACDKCKLRHVLVDLECVSCDDECVGVLLNVLDNVTDAISQMNFTGIIHVPYEILYNLENTTRNLRVSTIIWILIRITEEERQTYYVKDISLNATTAVHAHSSIQSFIEDAKNLVEEALRKTEITNLVRKNHWALRLQHLLFDRLKPLKKLEENLNRNLSEIKELINQARKQAASIKVAVSADRDCIRAYRPQISSTNYNTLMLNVKTTEPDNLLFYLGSSASSDFLAVEMRHGKVAFLWDVGSGASRLEFSDFTIDNNKWHQIYVTRFGNTGSLSIKEVSSTQKSSTKTAKSPGTANVLDVNESTVMFVGGLGGQIKKSSTVKVTHFKGCMGEAFLNGKSIGLWNYIEREGKCDGCFGSSQNEDSSFYFDGSGYSIVEKTLRSTVTQIIMLFSSFSPNGLLLYLTSNDTRDFLSIELVDGRIKLTVDLGSGPLVLITDKRYNNGIWYKIAFQRNRKQGKKHYEWTGMNVVIIGDYISCNITISFYFEVLNCMLNKIISPIRSASIFNEGYIELPPKPLLTESELMVTFATKTNSGIILSGLTTGKEKRSRRQANVVSYFKHYRDSICCYCCFFLPTRLSVQLSIRTFARSGLIYYMAHQNQIDYATLQLHEGQAYFMFDLGKGKAKASHPAFLSDGKWHTVSTRRFIFSSPTFSSPLYSLNYDVFYILNILYHNFYTCFPVKEGYKVRSDVTITLEFRTSEMNGVLLGISSAKVDAIGIEIINGKVLFHVNNGAGRITAVYEPKSTNSLCDGKWHKLQANKSKHQITLIVDGKSSSAESPHTQSTSADTNNPIYVGGYPADVKQNCLSSRTPFRGCMRKLTLTKAQQVESFDFSKGFDLQGVFPHSCPGNEN
uniref:Basement membrane-specific heparan sulfate proteoglycan core protein n=1 Tax=Monodelphis domestica TaxID=13616 RepID=A0A5F8G7E7_MONDO